MRALRLIILPLIVTLVACARNEEKIEDNNPVVKPTSFEGSWSQGTCQRDADPLAFLPGEFIQKFYLIEGQTYTFIQRGYEAPREGEQPCSANRLAYTLKENGVFALKKNKAGLMLSDDWEEWTNGQWGTMDVVGRSFQMTPASAQAVMLWNANKLCGIKEPEMWKSGVSRTVSNKFCFGVRMFRTQSETKVLRYEKAEDGKVFMTFGTLADNSDEPTFDLSLRFERVGNLPFSFKQSNKNNRNFIKGTQGN